MYCIEFFTMAGLVLDDHASPYGLTYAELVSSGIKARMNDTFGRIKQLGDSILFRLEGALRLEIKGGKCVLSPISPLAEIISLSTIAHPQPNEWVQHKISRSILDKEIIRPTDDYINAREDYLTAHHPELPQTRNMRLLGPHYALYLATNRAQELLSEPGVHDYEKVIALYPFVIASLSSLPLDVILLDPELKNRSSLRFAEELYGTIDKTALTEDQAMLLK